MTVKEMVANALYQRFCEAQGMYARTWADLPADRKVVWSAVADAVVAIEPGTLHEVQPWQTRETERRAA